MAVLNIYMRHNDPLLKQQQSADTEQLNCCSFGTCELFFYMVNSCFQNAESKAKKFQLVNFCNNHMCMLGLPH